MQPEGPVSPQAGCVAEPRQERACDAPPPVLLKDADIGHVAACGGAIGGVQVFKVTRAGKQQYDVQSTAACGVRVSGLGPWEAAARCVQLSIGPALTPGGCRGPGRWQQRLRLHEGQRGRPHHLPRAALHGQQAQPLPAAPPARLLPPAGEEGSGVAAAEQFARAGWPVRHASSGHASHLRLSIGVCA
jgi:hypothetical protein